MCACMCVLSLWLSVPSGNLMVEKRGSHRNGRKRNIGREKLRQAETFLPLELKRSKMAINMYMLSDLCMCRLKAGIFYVIFTSFCAFISYFHSCFFFFFPFCIWWQFISFSSGSRRITYVTDSKPNVTFLLT